MGGKNSAGYFQQVMQKVLADLLFLCVLIYIDDVLIFAKTEEQFIQAIGAVFEQLRVHRIYLKPHKCTLYAGRLLWCGHEPRFYSKDYGFTPTSERSGAAAVHCIL